jgi:hypothetical protein
MDDVFPVHPHIKMHLGTDEITFVIHMVELLHVDRLLYLGYYEPKDDGAGNRERCEAYFTHYSPGKKACIRAWDYNDDGPPSLESQSRNFSPRSR